MAGRAGDEGWNGQGGGGGGECCFCYPLGVYSYPFGTWVFMFTLVGIYYYPCQGIYVYPQGIYVYPRGICLTLRVFSLPPGICFYPQGIYFYPIRYLCLPFRPGRVGWQWEQVVGGREPMGPGPIGSWLGYSRGPGPMGPWGLGLDLRGAMDPVPEPTGPACSRRLGFFSWGSLGAWALGSLDRGATGK